MSSASRVTLLERIELPSGSPGASLYRVDLWSTVAFCVAAVAAVLAPGPLKIPFAVLSCVLFGAGTLAFLGAYGRSLGRSREEAITLGGVFGLAGSCPPAVQRRFHALTLVQVVVAIVTASIRPFTTQAFGILVPMLGLGIAGLWAATHGVFEERDDPRRRAMKQVEESLND